MKQVASKVGEMERSSSLNRFTVPREGLGIFTGIQLRDSLRTWLSPPDLSTNHNIACKARHEGSSEWFLQGSMFDEWKSSGSLLWIHGKRKFLVALTTQFLLMIFRFGSGLREEYTLVCCYSTLSLSYTYLVDQLRDHTKYHGVVRRWKRLGGVFLP